MLTHEFTADTHYFLKIEFSDADEFMSFRASVDGTTLFTISDFTGINDGWFSILAPVDADPMPSIFNLGYHTVSGTFYTNATFDGRELTLDGGTYLVGPPPPASEVPESSATFALLGASLAGVFAIRRRAA